MILKEFGAPLVWEGVPEPAKLGPCDALVESKANGLCATDLKLIDGAFSSTKTPLLLGHESAGVVIEVGSEVERVRPGDHVVMVNKITCGRCRMCRMGHEEMCLNTPGRLGMELDGGFGEFVSVTDRNLVKVASDVPLDGASLTGGTMASPFHAIRMARIELGESAAVFGLGGLGLHALQLLRYLGAKVIGVDVMPDKLEKARELGAAETINATEVDPVQAILDMTDGVGADVALEIVGGAAVPVVLQQCLELLRPGGRLILLGYQPGQTFPWEPFKLVSKWIQIIASHNHTVKDVEDVASLVNDGRVKPIISDRYAMEEANGALEKLRRGDPVGRIVLEW
jgi:propanol-preferring alcohol dehydrogenase